MQDDDHLGHESLGHQDLGADEPGHDDHGHDDHGHDDHGHDDHGDHPVESPGWVLVPLAVGAVLGVLVAVLLGLGSGAVPFHTL